MNKAGLIRHRLVHFVSYEELYGDLPMFADEEEWTMPFGNHQGKTLDQIPEDYKRWAIQNLSNPKIKQLFIDCLKNEQ